MKIQQQIEITKNPATGVAFAQIVMGSRRSGQQKYDSLEAAMRGSEAIVAKYGAQIEWAKPQSFTIKMIGTYEFEAVR